MTPLSREVLREPRIDERLEEPDHGLAAAQPGDLVGRWLGDAEDDIGARIQRIRGDDGRAGLRVGAVGDRRAGAGAGLDEDLAPGRLQLAECFGYQGDAPLSGRGLLGDTDLHGHHQFRRG